MIENHIFDLYGTLVDIHTDENQTSLWRRMALMLSLHGANYAPAELKQAYHDAVEQQIEGRTAQFPAIYKAYIEPDILPAFEMLYVQKGVSVSIDRLQDTAVLFRTLSMKHIRLYPEAMAVLKALRNRGQGVYLLSNAQAAFTVPELKMLGLYELFNGIVLSSDAGVKKPDTAIFRHILSKYGLRPETCLMVGNDEEADIVGAATAGMAGRYIHTKQSPPRRNILPPSCTEITSLKDLLR